MSEGIPETYQIIGRIGGGNSGVVYKAIPYKSEKI